LAKTNLPAGLAGILFLKKAILMIRTRRFLFLLLPCLLLLFSFSDNAHSPSSQERQLRAFASDPALKNASWGIYVVDVSSGRTIISHNEHLALVPASTQKVLTTASALLMLGGDFRYKTLLGYSGSIDQSGTLNGDIIIKGSGDPSLGSTALHDSLNLNRVFQTWLKAIKTAGIRQINGRVFADESVFDHELIPRKWLWEDMGNYYGAGSSGLTVNENMYTVYFKPGNALGQSAEVLLTEPVIPGMTFINQVKTGPRGSGDQVYIFGAPYQMQRTLTGTVPIGSSNFPVRGSMPDPALYVSAAFSDFLNQNQIAQNLPPSNQRIAAFSGYPVPSINRVLYTWFSPALTAIAGRTNLNSVNTYAENLLKTIGSQVKKEGTNAAGIEAMKDFWKAKGLDVEGMFLYDGSGLSPSNRITVYQLAQVLRFTGQSPVYESFQADFPLAGRTGSLASSFRGTPSEGVLRAKSGFIANVRSYAGYTKTADGKTLAFAFIVNDYHGTPASMREKMTKLMDAITRYNQ
jgi:serine-type D-Ala-D-Ala carboxypeptidase/endopeptidase (penicillin-binding protein 4)